MKTKTTILLIFLLSFIFESTYARGGELLGDANCDGVVNVLDVITSANYFSGMEPHPFCFENADVNGDGMINVMDIVLTIDIILGDDIVYGTVTDIDGNVYLTVIIGNQEWMAENLRVTRYNNGDDIHTGLDNTEWSNTTEGAYAIYPHVSIDGLDLDEEVVSAYGKLYNWYALDDSRGLCPEGWHVPSDSAWTHLVNYVMHRSASINNDEENEAGNRLKSCRQVDSPLDGCNTTEHPRWNAHSTHYGFDQFGFSALPGGARSSSGGFNIGSIGYWWTSTVHSGTDIWYRVMYSSHGVVGRFSFHMRHGNSVRCMRDVN